MRRTTTTLAVLALLLGLFALPMPAALAEAPECNDAIDNDGDGYTDHPNDPGCADLEDGSEAPSPECDDNIDNDADGNIDYPDDLACASLEDDGECTGCSDGPMPACRDGVDNDGDGDIDHPNDRGCADPRDGSEFHGDPPPPECDDRIDNDGDGWIDYPEEAGCSSQFDATELGEPAECEDGIDNDGDGATDHPADEGCFGEKDRDEESEPVYDPNCAFNGTSCDGVVLEKISRATLFGAVGDPSDRCRYQRSVRLKKVRPGSDRVVARFQTDAGGEFRRERPGRAGRYYAVAKRVELEDLSCSWRRSNSIRLRRNR